MITVNAKEEAEAFCNRCNGSLRQCSVAAKNTFKNSSVESFLLFCGAVNFIDGIQMSRVP